MASVRDAVFELLRSRGMTTVFGDPGSTEMAFLNDLPSDFRYILGLHEGAVVAMADGFAQATGRPTLVNLHSAPGVGNAMGSIVNARATALPNLQSMIDLPRTDLTSSIGFSFRPEA